MSPLSPLKPGSPLGPEEPGRPWSPVEGREQVPGEIQAQPCLEGTLSSQSLQSWGRTRSW